MMKMIEAAPTPFNLLLVIKSYCHNIQFVNAKIPERVKELECASVVVECFGDPIAIVGRR